MLGLQMRLKGKTPIHNFIVLEGLDGAGTTTQLQHLDKKLNEAGIPHWCTSEPTDGPVGRLLRGILQGAHRVQDRTIALLFAADRHEHLFTPGQGILARLSRGELVICDRYLFSSLAYQSLACGFEAVLELNRDFPLPEVCIFLDTPVEMSQKRIATRTQREIYEGLELQERIRASYFRAFDAFDRGGMTLHVEDGKAEPGAVSAALWRIISGLPMLEK